METRYIEAIKLNDDEEMLLCAVDDLLDEMLELKNTHDAVITYSLNKLLKDFNDKSTRLLH